MQTHAGTTGRTFSNPRGRASESGYMKKNWHFMGRPAFLLSWSFMSFLLLAPWRRWESSHFSIKRLWRKPNKEILPSSQITLFHLPCCTRPFKLSGDSELCKHIPKCTRFNSYFLSTEQLHQATKSYKPIIIQQYAFHSMTLNMSNHLKWVRTSNPIMLPRQTHKGRTIL